MTPSERKGLKIGDKVRIMDGIPPHCITGDIVTFVEDDGSTSPGFKRSTGEMFYRDLDYVEKLEPVDEVEHPSHYTDGAIECIDAIRAALSPTEFQGFLKGNALKYLWRMNLKGKTLVDAQKCDWYINRLVKELNQ